MRAITYDRYGSPDVLTVDDVPVPEPAPHQVLVRVRAAGLNPFDWHFTRGEPYIMRGGSGLRRPKGTQTTGADVAGEVVAVGTEVTDLAVGDAVFGSAGTGTCAEFAVVRATSLVRKPASLSFEHAAAMPMAGITALQSLRDVGALTPGDRILVNGASGGVGHLAVQLAKLLGAAHVTAVCSGRNADMVRALGADAVVDYTAEDFTRIGDRYDVILDIIGNHPLRALRRALTPAGRLVIVGAVGGGRLLGPAAPLLRAVVAGAFVPQRVLPSMNVTINRADLELIAGWADAGALTPVIDRVFPLEATADAMRRLEGGRVAGKVVVRVAQ